jgi:hypothetical protein
MLLFTSRGLDENMTNMMPYDFKQQLYNQLEMLELAMPNYLKKAAEYVDENKISFEREVLQKAISNLKNTKNKVSDFVM